MSGKGSGRRPGQGYQEQHDRIFGERPKKAPYVPPPLLDQPRSLEDILANFANWRISPCETPFLMHLAEKHSNK